MLRETKVGAVVACSFLGLLGVVVASKLKDYEAQGEESAVARAEVNEKESPPATPSEGGVKQVKMEEPGLLSPSSLEGKGAPPPEAEKKVEVPVPLPPEPEKEKKVEVPVPLPPEPEKEKKVEVPVPLPPEPEKEKKVELPVPLPPAEPEKEAPPEPSIKLVQTPPAARSVKEAPPIPGKPEEEKPPMTAVPVPLPPPEPELKPEKKPEEKPEPKIVEVPTPLPGPPGAIVPPTPEAVKVAAPKESAPEPMPVTPPMAVPMPTPPVPDKPRPAPTPAVVARTDDKGPPTNAEPPRADKYMEEDYRVKPGDSFASISKNRYGSEEYSEALARFNRNDALQGPPTLDKDGILRPGQTISLPDAGFLEKRYGKHIAHVAEPVKEKDKPGEAVPAAPKGVPYKVAVGGQTMREMARLYLGDGERRKDIYKLNARFAPERVVPAGTLLTLPADAKLPAETPR